MRSVAMVAFPAILIVTGSGHPIESPELRIDASPKNLVREKDIDINSRSFPGRNGNNAFTQCLIRTECEVPVGGARVLIKSCRAEASVQLVNFKVGGLIRVHIPRKPPRVLKAHEEGHVEICRRVVALLAESEARSALESFPSSYTVQGDGECSPEALTRRAQKTIDDLCGGLTTRVRDAIADKVGLAFRYYDVLTDHGRSDGSLDARPSVKGQGKAVEATLRDVEILQPSRPPRSDGKGQPR